MNKTTSVSKVQLSNGQEAFDLFNHESQGQAAIVDVAVIKRLAMLLPNVSFNTIRRSIMEDIEQTGNINELVKLMEEETAFHRTVNILTTVDFTQPELSVHHVAQVGGVID